MKQSGVFTKPFSGIIVDEHNVQIANDLYKVILQCKKETSKVRFTALGLMMTVNMEFYDNPNVPVTYLKIAKSSKRCSVNMVKRAHALLIELGVCDV